MFLLDFLISPIVRLDHPVHLWSFGEVGGAWNKQDDLLTSSLYIVRLMEILHSSLFGPFSFSTIPQLMDFISTWSPTNGHKVISSPPPPPCRLSRTESGWTIDHNESGAHCATCG